MAKQLDQLKIASILGSEIGGRATVTPYGVSVRKPRVSDVPAEVWKAVRNAKANLLMALADHLGDQV